MTRFLPHWRKATWALAIFTALMGVWIVTGTAIGGGIGVTFIVILWFIGFVVLGVVWLMSQPKNNVLIHGPYGQQMTVPEKEAERRIATGWTYQPKAS